MIQPSAFNKPIMKFNPFSDDGMLFDREQVNRQLAIQNKKTAVLVVEDDPIGQRVAQLTLENYGYQVDIAETGKKALALYQSNSYSVILMDLGLPDMSGTEVTSQIRKLEQKTAKHTLIIGLTAHGELAKQPCLDAGMDDFMTKPVPLEQLNQLIQSWLAK
jgi:two-component system aerobic respiration control sensor histidine kinase ArcB